MHPITITLDDEASLQALVATRVALSTAYRGRSLWSIGSTRRRSVHSEIRALVRATRRIAQARQRAFDLSIAA